MYIYVHTYIYRVGQKKVKVTDMEKNTIINNTRITSVVYLLTTVTLVSLWITVLYMYAYLPNISKCISIKA